ncbi:MAG: M28 family peptidase [Gemmatimonadales bacterium]|nr:M28 family peptidase [Gemmatimonadales bacterium]
MPLGRRVPLALLAVAAFACAAAEDAPPPPREFDGAQALRHVERQLAFGPRIPGTPGHAAMGRWLDSLLRARADTVVLQRWEHVTKDGARLPLLNVLARFNPAAPSRLLFLAHWDTRPVSDAPGYTGPRVPVPGANDGGSGVAVLLGMADALARTKPTIGVDLLFVDGEDYGNFTTTPDDVLIGSRHYARTAIQLGPAPRYAVLFDMVGDRDLQIHQEGNSVVAAPDVVELVWKTARRLGYAAHFPADVKHQVTDDHVELQKAGIRAIDLIDFDYPAWHTPGDTLGMVSAESLQKVGDVAMALVREAP